MSKESELRWRIAELEKEKEQWLHMPQGSILGKTYRVLFENSLDGFALCQMVYQEKLPVDFLYLDINSSFEKISGLTNVRNKKFSELFPEFPLKESPFLQRLAAVATSGTPEKFEYYFTPMSRWVSISVICPEPDYFVALFADITEKKNNEQKLIESEKKFKQIFESAGIALAMAEPTGGWIYVNKHFHTMLGYSREEFLKLSNKEITHPDDLEITLQKTRELLSNSIDSFKIEKRYLCKNGQVKWVELSIIKTDDRDAPPIFIGAMTNITVRKMMEERLRERERLYHDMFEKSKAIKGIIDPLNGAIIDVNSAAVAYYGYSLEQLKKMNIQDLNTSSSENILAEMAEALVEKKSHFEFRHKKANGEICDVEVYSSPIEIQGRNLLHSIVHDVTERKMTEENLKKTEQLLRELNATKDKFFSIIGHDLRTPFNAIVGYSNIISENVKSKDYADLPEYAGIIQSSARLAVELLSNLLEWSRSQTGKIKPRFEAIDLIKLIQEVHLLYKDAANYKFISIAKELPTSLQINADREMTKTILRNLVSNAIKFTDSFGKIDIRVCVEGSQAIISVSDNGVGMLPEDAGKLFLLGESQSTPGTQNERGTGLGLILSKEFAEKQGGKIWFESEKGVGTTFTFTIPKKQKRNKG